MPRLLLAVLLAANLLAPTARAADPVTDAMQAAYAPYRAALFRTNSKAQSESEQAIDETLRRWQELDRFRKAPPPPYAGDPKFGATVGDVTAVYREAEQLIRAGRLVEAHGVLERARDLQADLRQRNGVVVFSDRMNDYHAEMEHLLDHGMQLAQEPNGYMQLMARVGTLEYLATRLATQAPPELQRDAGFAAGQKTVADSVAELKAATLAQDKAAVQRALNGLKRPYSQLFLKYG